MRNIVVVGGGQVGLHLGVGLLRRGYSVRLLSNRTPEQIRNGRVLSSQAMVSSSLDLERAEGLELWADVAPQINGMHFSWLDASGRSVTRFSAVRERPALSIDQRLKMPAWMELFEKAGGQLDFVDADQATLQEAAGGADLVIVAAGKGDISGLFPVDTERLEYTTPQRHLALAYMNGVEEHSDFEGNDFVKRDGMGEMFMFPALTTTGPCHIMTIEAVPGGVLDVFQPDQSATALVEQLKVIALEEFPSLGKRLRSAQPTDDQATLVGRFAPTIRQPVAQVADGVYVLGAGDVVMLNDPLTGQGANNAARCADLYLRRITSQGLEAYSRQWLVETGEAYVRLASGSAAWTNATLVQWPDHVRAVLTAAEHSSALASLFAEGFGDADKIWAWWRDPAEAKALLSPMTGQV